MPSRWRQGQTIPALPATLYDRTKNLCSHKALALKNGRQCSEWQGGGAALPGLSENVGHGFGKLVFKNRLCFRELQIDLVSVGHDTGLVLVLISLL